MRILIFILSFVSSFAFAQQKTPTPLEKVKSAVRKHLSLTMKDYSSYKPVQWSGYEVIYTDYLETERAGVLLDSVKKMREDLQPTIDAGEARLDVSGIDLKTDSVYLYYKKELDRVIIDIEKILNFIKAEQKVFKKRLKFYTITHTYRGKNSYGAYNIATHQFTLLPNFKVIDVIDPDEDDEDEEY